MDATVVHAGLYISNRTFQSIKIVTHFTAQMSLFGQERLATWPGQIHIHVPFLEQDKCIGVARFPHNSLGTGMG